MAIIKKPHRIITISHNKFYVPFDIGAFKWDIDDRIEISHNVFDVPPMAVHRLEEMVREKIPNARFDELTCDYVSMPTRMLLRVTKGERKMNYLHDRTGVFPSDDFCAVVVLFCG